MIRFNFTVCACCFFLFFCSSWVKLQPTFSFQQEEHLVAFEVRRRKTSEGEILLWCQVASADILSFCLSLSWFLRLCSLRPIWSAPRDFSYFSPLQHINSAEFSDISLQHLDVVELRRRFYPRPLSRSCLLNCLLHPLARSTRVGAMNRWLATSTGESANKTELCGTALIKPRGDWTPGGFRLQEGI